MLLNTSIIRFKIFFGIEIEVVALNTYIMRVFQFIFLFLFSVFTLVGQDKPSAFNHGETMLFKIKYGFISAGYGELKVHDKGEKFHFEAKGWSASFFDPFFKVRDYYDSYVYANNMLPYYFTRDVEEGNFKKKQNVTFENEQAFSEKKTIDIPTNTQDLVSFFYYLRSQNLEEMTKKESIIVPIYLDDEVFEAQFTYKEDEKIRTIVGRKNCMVFSVKVMSGRVFGDSEPLKVWVTKDDQKLPVKLKADIAVGSIKMILDEYKSGL